MVSALRVAQRFLEAVIRKEKGQYCVKSPNNPDWNGGCYDSKEEAEKRLQQVEFFKRQSNTRLAVVGDVSYPEGHKFGLKVPKGGSACSKCKFLSEDGKHCGSEYFQRWHKSVGAKDPALIPEPADQYCCDVYEP